MKKTILRFVLLMTLVAAALAARIGEPAPDFTATDSNGKTHRLSGYKGKYVVLEWHNQGCPYTKKHYESGNMQRLQKEWTARGVVWLSVISSAPGTQGYVSAAEENDYLKRMSASPTAVLLDSTGEVGHLYAAKTTPHMFIIDPGGALVYNGAIDDHPTSDASDIPGSKNYVASALREAMAGQKISEPATRPYGCSVKYKE
ncbi:MAG TPA: thioredoxin family protein [Candidatus Saccharimonadales bacterium]|jgi:peroxiredoxin|nr:thioredoxin family protein [Candidatus Saccharimonadales bacterium]